MGMSYLAAWGYFRDLERAAGVSIFLHMRTLLIVIALVGMVVPSWAQSGTVILSTTTSTQDSGLLDLLVPMFEKKTGMTVKTISVGTGQALALAARGEADVALVHAPPVAPRSS